MEQVSASLSTGDPELMDLIGVIASRLIENMPTTDSEPDERKDALLERALMYAAQAEQQIASQNQRIEYLQSLSFTDELTGLFNRRGFAEQLSRTLAAARRFGHTGVLVYCDLDNFKEINDSHGHCVGDRVLKRIAFVARQSLREIDTIARLGGDEFAMLIAQTKWADGQKHAQSLQWAIESKPTDGLPEIKVSLGIEPYGPNDTPEELVRRADMAMYYVKRRKKGPMIRDAAE
ncbi:MAG: GGDEF domain-containing protein [Alphaproteobacteria bacterium]